MDPIARMRAVAEKLGAVVAPPAAGGEGEANGLKRKASDYAPPATAGGRKKVKIFVPPELCKERNAVGLLLGARGNTIKFIQMKSGAKLAVKGVGTAKPGMGEDNEPLHVVVEGTDEQIAVASAEIDSILKNPDDPERNKDLSHMILIPESVSSSMNILGVLIGPKGSNLRGMMERSGAKISIRGKGSQKDSSSRDHTEPLHVLVEGSEYNVSVARREVENIIFNPEEANRLKERQLMDLAAQKNINHGGIPHAMIAAGAGPYGMIGAMGGVSGYKMAESQNEVTFAIPNGSVGFIVGKGGQNIQKLQREYGVNIQVKGDTPQSEPMRPVPIIVSGPHHAVEIVRGILQGMVEEKKQLMLAQALNEGALVATLVIPSERVGLVIGRGGCTIKAIQARTGATVKVPPQPDPNDPAHRTITFTASNQRAIDGAMSEIKVLIEAGPDGIPANSGSTTMVLEIPAEKVGLVLGKGGMTVKSLQLSTGAQIRVDVSPGENLQPGTTRKVTITGVGDAAVKAKFEIEALVLLGDSHGRPGGLQQSMQHYGGGAAAGHYGNYGGGGGGAQMQGQHGGMDMYGQQQHQPQQQQQQQPQHHQQHQQQQHQHQQQHMGAPPQMQSAPQPPPAQQPYPTMPAYPPQQPGYGMPMPPAAPQAPLQAPQAGGAFNAAAYMQQLQQAVTPHGGMSQQQLHAVQAQIQAAQAQVHAQIQAAQQAAQRQQQQPAFDPYAAAYGQLAAASAMAAPAPAVDTTYHQQFWQYAAYYGERVAREQYGMYAPPLGTQPPPGVTLPPPGREPPPP